jgi:UDP-2-acetamido-3-amino-2,3-dideoxy-glucuronate N-acetyltransferase
MVIENDIVTLGKQVHLDNGTIINRYCHIVSGAQIGENCMIGQNCYVGNNAKIGDRVRIQNGNNIWDYITISNDVFIAPCVCLTNDHNPHDRFLRKLRSSDQIIIGNNSTICTNSTIIAPCLVGDNVLIAAGSVVLRNIESNAKVWGIVK